MLEVRGLRASHGRVEALKGVDLTVSKGELVGVVGPNGAGKSTLLLCIAGGLKPTAGEIMLEGDPLAGLSPDAIVRRGACLVPENRRIFTSLTVAENLRVALSSRRDKAAARRDLSSKLDLFPALRRYEATPAGRLSGGEQQQLAIARALVTQPRLLLVDEPSLGLAPQLVDQVFSVLGELRASGVTILLVEQNAARTAEMADRLYVMRTGECWPVDAGSDISAAVASGELYFGRPVAGVEDR